ncbi:hypothetical protein BLNAU_16194 [Blattamonas nauphoetae]|uniref:Uncharacterized protein n=1 Tax=Blattamonas nauphoetae TaxID=2049346 RepID=A0ABQ9XEX5_9EUKA|nr:hypothetical protein BLNAU_16194 [Blattamonas nauphoetae]
MTDLVTNTSSCTDSPYSDCSPFVNWSEEQLGSESENATLFLSLVATIKLQPVLDDSLKAKAVKFLESVHVDDEESADAFLHSLQRNTDESLTNVVQSIVVLISLPNEEITKATMKILKTLFSRCSAQHLFTVVQADLIPRLINTLNPQSVSFVEAEDIHIPLLSIITDSVYLSTTSGLARLEIEDDDEQQAVHETVFQQVVVPSKVYLWHLCTNRFSIADGQFSAEFMDLLAVLLEISPYYQSMMDLSPSTVANLSFSMAVTPALLLCARECVDRSMDGVDWWEIVLTNQPKCFFSHTEPSLVLLTPEKGGRHRNSDFSEISLQAMPFAMCIDSNPLHNAGQTPNPLFLGWIVGFDLCIVSLSIDMADCNVTPFCPNFHFSAFSSSPSNANRRRQTFQFRHPETRQLVPHHHSHSFRGTLLRNQLGRHQHSNVSLITPREGDFALPPLASISACVDRLLSAFLFGARGRQRRAAETLGVADCWTSRTDPLDVDVGEKGRRVRRKRETAEAKRRKCTTLLSHISPPVSTTADEDRRRFLSLSPTTPQLMTSCPVTRPKANANRSRGKDEIAVSRLQTNQHKPTPRWAQSDRTPTLPTSLHPTSSLKWPQFWQNAHPSASSPSLTPCVGAVW